MTHLLGLVGSLRKDSLNRKLLRALATRLPEGVTLVEHDLRAIPLFDGDLVPPESVLELKQAVASASGVVIACPEFNYGIPGVLKNALDWASRPAYQSVFAGKPVAILGAAPGPIGTARAQGQLKLVLLGMVAQVFPYPEVTVGNAAAKFDEQGELVDSDTESRLRSFGEAFVRSLPPG